MNLGMLRLFKLIITILFVQNLYANTTVMDFNFIKKGIQDDNTLLIVGGIQGDEPGAFMAASLISTHYKIKKGSVWVVPNLNFYSIIKRNRGPFGDMNRKFAELAEDDPDFNSIQRIKKYITAPEVKLVLNLHDGSGFYRKEYRNWSFSPDRWGQSSIIDQTNLDIEHYGNLEEISKQVCEHVNNNLLRQRDEYRVKNTHTRMGDKEMEKTLTYYAINNGKAAFGNEASKSLPLYERTYYHLHALEKYMEIMGIEFERKFDLNLVAIKDVIDNDIYISFYDDKIHLPLSEVRDVLKYFPVKKDGTLDFKPSNPLMTIVRNDNFFSIYYGNRLLANLKPDYFEMENLSENILMNIDGEEKAVKIGSIVDVDSDFEIKPIKDYRVNVIGFVKKGKKNEVGINIEKHKILKDYSIDKKGKLFRVEFYKKDKFAGMVLINFDKGKLKKIKNSIASNEDKESTFLSVL
ncbi:M14 family metallopeptidase [Arcobacter arenosus]|jgi:hypothetical protein|uniref:Deacylase n=1 Tax=Arcobacter arenosus TaxID=2576037 RepID=A0A5R8Y2C0_9BACT|nr:M14 family metallopeptidase [Arcobacter arenosus]TLP38605.1 deacylase [Arcobacter arenosus]